MVHEKVIAKHIQEELPFMASENIMMDAVRRGGDRQVLHEEIRKMSIEAGRVVKEEGGQNNLLELIAQNPMFGMSLEEISAHMDPSLILAAARSRWTSSWRTLSSLSWTNMPLPSRLMR